MEKEILTKKFGDKEVEEIASYSDERMVFVDNLQNLDPKISVRIEAFVVVLCLKGKASLFVDDQFHEIQVNDVFICHPNIILESSMISMDFECRSICLSPEYVRQLTVINNDSWDIRLFLEKNPVLSLTQDEVRTFCWYYDLLKYKLTTKNKKYRKELVDALLLAFLYEFHDTLDRFITLKPSSYKSAENLFKTFIDLLASSYPKKRSVSYYADCLHVSPKYFSAVCKDISGQPASDLIDQYVMKDVVYLLRKTEKSIKEITNELDFPNISFFGKYVKKHLGLSPRMYREKQEKEFL
ncbi:uncharacterized protein BN646_00579 [Parabacteroides sp. CAG:409]|mgnify:FL=1|nr:uncharacterized protein BN646_00579 [Parabacteroides sp. CAG:409]